MNRESQSLSTKVFFPNLDGLRTIAFLFVYIQHGFWGSFEHLDIQESVFFSPFIYGVTNGGTGVSIFFVLSGFLITYLLLTEMVVNGKINVGYFYIRRVLRIWPLYFAVIFFAFAVYPFLKSLIGIDSDLASRPLYYISFLSNFDVINVQRFYPGDNALMEGITWSVAIEEQFYLLWPLLFLVTHRRYYLSIFLSVIVICLFFRFINRDDKAVLYFHSLSVCADLAIGGLCAYLSVFSSKFTEFFSRINKKGIVASYLMGFTWLFYGSYVMNSFTGPILFRLVSTCFFAFIILEQNISANSFYKFSGSKVLTFWGKYTYGLYLLHPIALLILDVGLRIMGVPYKDSFLPFFMVGIAGLGLSLTLSYISYEYYEKRFLRLKEKFSFVPKKTKIPEYCNAQIQKHEKLHHDQVA